VAYNSKTLIGIGLEDAASWKLAGDGLETVGCKAARWRWLTARPGALYALCSGDKVLHIGRSATTLSKRFAALGDAANASLHQAIRKILATGKEVRILVLTDHPTISWGPFAIDLAAGLEESLIRAFKPPWHRTPRVPL
jgi:hypothetical protein